MRLEHLAMRDTFGRRWLRVFYGLLGLSRKKDAPPSAPEAVTEEAFQEALRSLNPEIGTVYEGHLRGLSRPELAHLLNLPEDVVSRRLSDARRQLRSLLFCTSTRHPRP